MKIITLKFLIIICLFATYGGISQTLNEPANWPNAAWTLSGTYTPAGLLSDPTVADATFTWDDDSAGNGSIDNLIVTSPVIDLTAASGAGETSVTISGDFVYRALGGDVLNIEVYDADAMTWSAAQTFAGNSSNLDFRTCTSTAAYTTLIIDISAYTATQLSGFQYRFTYYDNSGWQWGFCLTSPTIVSTSPPSCADPTALTATNLMDIGADLAWTENGTATLWDVEILTSTTPPTGTPTDTGVTNPFTATTLAADTSYDYYVRADCGIDGTSGWAGPYTFRTACAAVAVPYVEDFETFTTSGSAFIAENCWTGTGGDYFWESAPGTDNGSGGTGPDPSITTGNYFYTEASNGVIGNTTDLVSPNVDLTGLIAPSLTFNYHMFGGQIGTLDIIVNGTTNVWTLSGQQQGSATTPWELAFVDLSAYAGQTISITFRATSAGTFEGDIAIDNVSFGELPTCPGTSTLTATSITDVSADLGWTENGTAVLWDVELVDITAAGTPTGTPTASGVANPYSATGLTQNNNYAFYVRSDCGGGTLSSWAGPFAFSTLETCPTPSALTATNIMETTADLGWVENGIATSWNVELVDITAGGTVTGTATASGVMNPYGITGLVGDNSYQFYVQADCGVDGVSAWAGPFSFATPYVAVPPDCTNGTFLDSGGASSNYSSNENITYTICPDSPGDVVYIDFTAFSTENNGTGACYDGLTIHNGADATATTIDPPGGGTIWCWDRNDTPAIGTGDLQGMTIVSTDPSGCITFVFTSDGSVQRAGWEAIVTCAPPAGLKTWNGTAWVPAGAPAPADPVVIAGDFTAGVANDGDLDVASIVITTGTTTIPAGTFVKSNGNITVDPGASLLVQHEGSLVQVDDAASVTNNGTISVEKTTPNMAAQSFMVSGSPMTTETREGVFGSSYIVRNHVTGNFSPNIDVEALSPGINNWADDNGDNWLNHSGLLNPGEGYMVFPQPDALGSGTYTQTHTLGTLNNGVVNFTTGYNGTQNSSPNMLANPYASAIDAEVFFDDPANADIDAVYFWEHLTPLSTYPGYNVLNFSMGDISIYSASMGAGVPAANGGAAPTRYIASGQGFGVKPTAGGIAQFNNAMRVTGPNDTYRSNDVIARDRLWLKVYNDTYGLGSTTLIGFTETTSDGFSISEDVHRLPTPVSLYSELETGEELVVNALGTFETSDAFYLSFSTQVKETQSFRISIDNLDGVNMETASVYLIDSLTGIVTNLSEGDYTFQSGAAVYHKRFKVVFENAALGINDSNLDLVSIYPNPTQHSITIVSPQTIVTSATVYDIRGRKVSEVDFRNQTNYRVDLSTMEVGIYFIDIITESGTVTKRVIKQ
jgi:hypothetical protein